MRTSYIFVLIAAITLLWGCGSAEYAGYDAAEPTSMAMEEGNVSYEKADSSGAVAGAASSLSMTPAKQESERLVVRNGSIDLRVDDVSESAAKVEAMVREGGGYIESSNSSGFGTSDPVVNMTVRIPENGFSSALGEIRNMGTVLHETTDAEDVTMQMIDLDARIKTMSAKEETLRSMLTAARNVNDIISIQDQLTNVRTEIEIMSARREKTLRLAKLSTLSITLSKNAVIQAAPSDPNWFNQSLGAATTKFMSITRGAVSGILWIAIFAPLWLIPVGVVLWARKQYKARSSKSAQQPL